MKFHLVTIFFVILFTAMISYNGKIQAQSLTVYAEVEDTAMVFKGYFSPNSLISFTEDNVTIGTISTDSNGYFEKEFTAVDPGSHEVIITGTSPRGLLTVGVLQNVFLLPHQRSVISDIILPPTILVEQTNPGNTNDIRISGYARPNSIIEIDLSGPSGTLILTETDMDGFYQKDISSSTLEPGEYTVRVKVVISVAIYSILSQELNFTVVPRDNHQVIVVNPPDLNEEGQCIFLKSYPKLCIFDKDHSGLLNIYEELRNLIFGFITYNGQLTNNAYDINNNGIVDGADLSIALYYVQSLPYDVLGVSNGDEFSFANQASVSYKNFNQLENPLSLSLSALVRFQLILATILLGILLLLITSRRYNAKRSS